MSKILNTLNITNLADTLDSFDTLIDHIVQLWENKSPNDLRVPFKKKRQQLIDGGIRGYAIHENNQVKGMVWLENIGLHYGNLVLHCVDKKYEESLAHIAVDKGLFQNALLEIIKYVDTETYTKVFKKRGISYTVRRRMGLYVDEWEPVPILRPNISFRPITIADIEVSSEISYQAHQDSGDQDLAIDMATRPGRIDLENALLNSDQFGKRIPEATILMQENGVPIGICSAVEVACWGLERVPWIFDFCVHPDHHGRGLGRILMIHVLNQLKQSGYTAMGLTVTKGNSAAEGLYESVGFKPLDDMIEFGYPISEYK